MLVPRTPVRRAISGGLALGAGLAALANPFMPPMFWIAVGGTMIMLAREPKKALPSPTPEPLQEENQGT